MKNACLPLILALSACNRSPKDSAPLPAPTGLTITRTDWGRLPDGRALDLFTLKNARGMTVTISNYGGIVTSWTAADRNGRYEDVVLGYDSIGGYLDDSPYFGALIGRYGNRIAKGKFQLDGNAYTLAVNNIGNHLHGGLRGFDKVVWNAQILDDPTAGPTLRLNYLSADGEEGYPGNLDVTVLYTLTHADELRVRYEATTDRPTVINLTQHSYFNLSGETKRDILDHQLALYADRFLPVDKTLIPTGELRAVEGTVFDFRQPTRIGARIDDPGDPQIAYGGGYDHCWVLSRPADGKMQPAAALHDPVSGRYLEVVTTEPAIQFYSGNFLDGTITGKNGAIYRHRFGLCLETQHFPDSPNQQAFPSTVLRPGERYVSETVFRFTVKKDG